jgi:hypothetical protein
MSKTIDTALIAEFKNKREAELVAELIRAMPKAKVLQKGKNLEDIYFAELITNGMKEKGIVNLGKFRSALRNKIDKRQSGSRSQSELSIRVNF